MHGDWNLHHSISDLIIIDIEILDFIDSETCEDGEKWINDWAVNALNWKGLDRYNN